MNINVNFNSQTFASNRCENLPDKIMKDTITTIIDKPNMRTLRFIKNVVKSGMGVGSLKYLIVESNITLLIEALNPLSK